MSFNVEVTSFFRKQAKRLLKKYPSLKDELNDLISTLENSPIQGDQLGNNCYKIRLKIASKGKGKSGGARIITHVQIIHKRVFLLSIYDKSEQGTISEKDVNSLLKLIP